MITSNRLLPFESEQLLSRDLCELMITKWKIGKKKRESDIELMMAIEKHLPFNRSQAKTAHIISISS